MGSGQSIQFAHGDVSHEIIGAFLHVYNRLGNGLAESVYHSAMVIALGMRGLRTQREMPLAVYFEGIVVGVFRADMVVEQTFLVELKSVEKLLRVHEAQVYNYLRISKLPAALLMNFGPQPVYRRLVLPSRPQSNE